MAQRAQYCFRAQQGCFQHAEKFKAQDAVECSDVFLSLETILEFSKTVLSTSNHC